MPVILLRNCQPCGMLMFLFSLLLVNKEETDILVCKFGTCKLAYLVSFN